jgi:hypothetical protein
LYIVISLSVVFSLGCGGNNKSLKPVHVLVFYNPNLNETEGQALKVGLRRLVKEFIEKDRGFSTGSSLKIFRIPDLPQIALQEDTCITLSKYSEDDLGAQKKVNSYIDNKIHFTNSPQELFEVFMKLREEFSRADYILFYSNMIQNGTEYNFYNCEDSIVAGRYPGRMIYNIWVAERNLSSLLDRYKFRDDSKKRIFTFINTSKDLRPTGDCLNTLILRLEIKKFWSDFLPDKAKCDWYESISSVDSLFKKL